MITAKTPITIGAFTIKNRLTMAPTVKFDTTDDSAFAQEFHVSHYRERAHYGCGLICVEATAVHPAGRFCKTHMGLWNDDQIPGQAAIAQACHEEGAVVIIQLNHAGYSSNPECGEPIGPSEHVGRGGVVTRAMTIEEVHEMEQCFIDAAIRAKKAGYDGVQLHACHAYMINQFASPVVNHRTDEYGGSAKNRARFGCNIIAGIRKACGPDFLISARISACEPEPEDAIPVAEAYVAAGCDYLQVSNGCGDFENPEQMKYSEAELAAIEADPELGAFHKLFPKKESFRILQMTKCFKQHFDGRIPISGVNGIYTPNQVAYLLENGYMDTVDLARALLADPEFSRAVLEGGSFMRCYECPRCQFGPFTQHKCPANRKKKMMKK